MKKLVILHDEAIYQLFAQLCIRMEENFEKGFQGGSVVGSFASPDHLFFARALYDKADVLYIGYFSLYSPRMQDVNK